MASRAATLLDLSECAHPDAAPAVVRPLLLATVQQLKRVLPVGLWPQPYQLVALAYAELAQDRCLIADEQGLGKTVEAILRVVLKGYAPVVVVAPTSMVYRWQDELKTWAPKLPVYVVDGQSRPMPPPGWRGAVITTWGLLDSHVIGLGALRPQLLIADEAHNAVNPEARRTRALHYLAERVPHVLLLTGTPAKNTAEDLWALLNVVDPKEFPDPAEFAELDPEDVDIGHETAMQRRIRRYMLRRLKVDVLPHLPAKRHTDVVVVMPPDMRAQYDAAEQRFRRWLADTLQARLRAEAARTGVALTSTDIVEQVYRRVRRAMNAEYLSKIGHLRKLAGMAKVGAATEWALNHARSHEPCVLFAEHAEVIASIVAGLRARGVVPGVIVGATPPKERARIVEAFQAGQLDVVVASQAAKEGVTLTRARALLRVERWWTSAAEDQGDDRLHRLGQTRDVRITVLHAERSIDMHIADIVRAKRAIIERVVGATPIDVRNASA